MKPKVQSCANTLCNETKGSIMCCYTVQLNQRLNHVLLHCAMKPKPQSRANTLCNETKGSIMCCYTVQFHQRLNHVLQHCAMKPKAQSFAATLFATAVGTLSQLHFHRINHLSLFDVCCKYQSHYPIRVLLA